MRLVYRVISCDELGGSIACAWNSILLHNTLFHAQPDKVWVES